MDFEKAFDSISHSFIIQCLKHFNFGDDLINWVKLFYTDIKGIILNNGHLSDSFSIERGVRQGCPLSSFLFLICIEVMANHIEHCQEIEGIKINDTEIKQTLFADDATFFNNGKESSYKTLIYTIEEFGKLSGLKVNYSKTLVLQIGSLKGKKINFQKGSRFVWTSSSAKTLGITFSNDCSSFITENITPKLQDFKKCLKQWHHRKLTLIGKVSVVRTFALPKLILPFTVLPDPPDKLIDEIQKSIFMFIWDNKPDKIKRDQLYLPKESGGLNLPNIKTFINALKASWVKRFVDENNKGKWKIFFQNILKKRGGEIYFECTLDTKDIKSICNKHQFINDVLNSWTQFQSNIAINDMRKTIIWNNSNIKCNAQTFYYKQWHERGILYLEHIFDFRVRTFYTFNNIQYLYQIPNGDYLRYLQLIKSIPLYMTNELKNIDISQPSVRTSLLENIKTRKKITKFLYNKCITKNIQEVNHKEKWENLFNKPLDWKEIYKMPYIATIDTCIQAFQYKLINRIIPTNTYLFKCKLTNSNLCDLCSCDIETIVHLFWECPVIQHLWSNLKSFLQSKGITIELNLSTVLLGVNTKTNYSSNNFLILLMKYFIYCSKYRKVIPNFQLFKSYLNARINVEREIAISKNKLNIHLQKWDFLS